MRFRAVFGAAVVMATLTAACGSDDDAASTTPAPTEAPSATTAAASDATDAPTATDVAAATDAPATTGAAADDTPVKILVILDESAAANNFLDTARAGAQARADRINAEGGLGGSGHPVELDFCVTDLDPNKTAECVQKAADDPAYIAAAGGFASAGDTATPLAAAGLASVPGAAFIPSDWGGENVFNINSGAFIVAAVGTLACSVLGYESLVEGRSNLPASQAASALVDMALASNGCAPLTQSIDIAVDAADVSAQVAALGDADADAVTLDILPSMSEQIFPARTQLGIDRPFVAASGEFTNESVANMADDLEGTPIVAWMPTDDFDSPGNKQYLADFEASGADAGLNGDTARSAYVAIDLVDFAAKSAASIDRAGILDALNGVSSYDGGGLTPTLDFTKPGPNPAFPRMFNLSFFHATVKDGKFASAGDGFVPIFGSAG